MYFAHAQWCASQFLANAGVPILGLDKPFERERAEGRLIKPYHRTSDIIYHNAETLGWDWGVHPCRSR
jgi:hypothetical protein